uniref:Putative secreted protein n=1 Tax=Ixodes ricinus TaxID=34613 RepID=A0A6B0U507_IXORI
MPPAGLLVCHSLFLLLLLPLAGSGARAGYPFVRWCGPGGATCNASLGPGKTLSESFPWPPDTAGLCKLPPRTLLSGCCTECCLTHD